MAPIFNLLHKVSCFPNWKQKCSSAIHGNFFLEVEKINLNFKWQIFCIIWHSWMKWKPLKGFLCSFDHSKRGTLSQQAEVNIFRLWKWGIIIKAMTVINFRATRLKLFKPHKTYAVKVQSFVNTAPDCCITRQVDNQ